MSKYETFEALRGRKTVNLWEVLETRRTWLEDFREKFGSDQTITDQKFFKEKLEKLQQYEDLIQDLLHDLDCRDRPRNYDITISVSEK